jgi:hypothetical protein
MKDIEYDGEEWIYHVQDRKEWLVLLNTVILGTSTVGAKFLY